MTDFHSNKHSHERRRSTASTNIDQRQRRIAVLVPCFNEARTIASVVQGFRNHLPNAIVYVCDNNSTDDTATIAREAGAIVWNERRQGKGHAVRRMFANIDADAYILVDGDDTYDSSAAPEMLKCLFEDGLDMVTAKRIASTDAAYRRGHVIGNRLLTQLVGFCFGRHMSDLLSGYRALSKRFVKSFPVLLGGFELETEMTVHALGLHMPQAELDTVYRERPSGSESKLNTYRDGVRIFATIIMLIKEERPLLFFSILFALLATCSVLLVWPIFMEFIHTGLVPRLPTAVLATGMMLLAFLSLTCGLILDTVTRGRRELKRLAYLGVPGPSSRRFGE